MSRGHRWLCGALGALVAMSAPAVAATQRTNESVAAAGPVVEFTTTPELGCATRYRGDAYGEYYGNTACATVIAVNGQLYAPSSIPAGGSLTSVSTPYSAIGAQSAGGSGSVSSPRFIRTIVQAGPLLLTQTDSYVDGSERVATSIQLSNTTSSAVSADLFRAGDCFAQDSDTGYGQMTANSAACVSGNLARTVRFVATQAPGAAAAPAGTFEGFYDDLWKRIATFAPGGTPQPFDGSCRCGENIDNSAGLQWTLSVPAGGTVTVTSAVDFGPIATPGGLGTGASPAAPQAPGGFPYVALGDSFSSGEGAGDPGSHRNFAYLPGTDVPGNRCHRSANAYPRRIASSFGLNLDRFDREGFRACSGAVTADLFNANAKNVGEPAQVDAVGADSELVTLTIGGNDAQFSDIVKACVDPRKACQDLSDQTTGNFHRLAILSGDASLLQTYQRIRQRMAPSANLVVFGGLPA